ncbi:hypothetical protein PG996_014569 [Apiospora saccharicola]|uniref:Uncharacterized protein n=1 Tax=Apiospora saccharicola TaxID=335842 RepID=A0ABR1TKP2_9PEZI
MAKGGPDFDPDEILQNPTFSRSIGFIQHKRFQQTPQVYNEFLAAFSELRVPGQGTGSADLGKAVAVVHAKMKSIFENQQDLLREFETFLPEWYDDGVKTEDKE